MPSFDIVSRVDLQEMDNAVNNVNKELDTRYDFRGVRTEIDLNRKDKQITVTTGDEMKYRAVRELLITHCVRRKVDPKALEFGEPEPAAKAQVRGVVKIKEGVEKAVAQRIVKLVKDLKLKVQTQIQDEQVRVTGKKIDDLQAVIKVVEAEDFGIPLQYINMKS
jgi:cyclic-di-GMP-binding protein